MNLAKDYGLYPPPNRFDRHPGTCDLRSDASIALAGIGADDIEPVRAALASAGVGEIVLRDAAPAGLGPALVISPGADGGAAIRVSGDGIPNEGYRLVVDSRGATLLGHDARGIRYGIDSLARLVARAGGNVPCCAIEDAPASPIRAVHLFIPAREDIPFFCRLLDSLAALRYNAVFLEIAAGMEFVRHPEINRAWKGFHRELMAHPRGPKGLQESMWFDWKNDPHATLAGGSWIVKDEARRIADRAASLGIEIIPEVQSLAHSYWLTIAHPEIAEAQDDPFPDTYCPSDPRSYTLLFDVMDEVIEVFRPRTIHIGHDEVYTMHRCPRCRRKSAVELFAGDVTKIHDRLASRGVGTAMWADKLLDIRHPNGETYGGQFRRVFKGRKQWVMPPTHAAVDGIPRDILLVDWYWMLDDKTPDIMAEKGFERLIFGNFAGTGGPRWPELRRKPIVRGAEISTWCRSSEDDLGRHGMFHRFVEGACTLWARDYDPATGAATLAAIAQDEMPALRVRLADRRSPVDDVRIAPETFVSVPLDDAPREPFPLASVAGPVTLVPLLDIPFAVPMEDGKPTAVAVRFASPIVRIPLGVPTRELVFLLGTSIARPYRSIDDEMARGKDVAGRLRFHYGAEDAPDRDAVYLDLVYGDALVPWRARPGSYHADPAMAVDTPDERLTLYAVGWENPHPERAVRQVDLVWLGGRTMEGEICLLGIAQRE